MSSAFDKLSDAAQGRTEATLAVALAESGSRVVYYDDFGVFATVTGKMSLPEIREFVRTTIGALEHYDQKKHTELLTTLRVLMQHNGQIPETAAELSIHLNTVHQRIARIEDITGLNLRSYRDLARVTLALDLMPVASPEP